MREKDEEATDTDLSVAAPEKNSWEKKTRKENDSLKQAEETLIHLLPPIPYRVSRAEDCPEFPRTLPPAPPLPL